MVRLFKTFYVLSKTTLEIFKETTYSSITYCIPFLNVQIPLLWCNKTLCRNHILHLCVSYQLFSQVLLVKYGSSTKLSVILGKAYSHANLHTLNTIFNRGVEQGSALSLFLYNHYACIFVFLLNESAKCMHLHSTSCSFVVLQNVAS